MVAVQGGSAEFGASRQSFTLIDFNEINLRFDLCKFIEDAGTLTGNAMWQQDGYRMIQRRARATGIKTKIGNHTFVRRASPLI